MIAKRKPAPDPTAFMDEDGPDSELRAAPGRKFAEADHLGQEWYVSMYAGTELRKDVPSIPIASFYGPHDRADAQLFAGAAHLYEVSKAQDMLYEAIHEFVAAAEGKVDIINQPMVRKVRFAGQMARMLCQGVEVVVFCGHGADGAQFHKHKMPIRLAIAWLNHKDNVMTGLASAGDASLREAAHVAQGAV